MFHFICCFLLLLSTFLASYKVLLPLWIGHQHVLDLGPALDRFAHSHGGVKSEDATASADNIITLPLQWGPMPQTAILYTSISVGSPPQPFRTALDLTWGGLAVRSAVCFSRDLWGAKTECEPPWEPSRPRFNRSASSSWTALCADAFTPCSDSEWCGEIKGNLSLEALHLMESNVPGIVLGEIEHFDPNFMFSALDFFGGIIGLGPPRADSHIWYNGSKDASNAIHLPNLLHQLSNSPSIPLGHKTMLLRFPANNETNGTLTLGEAAPTALDLSLQLENCNTSSPDCTNTWDVKIAMLRLLGSPHKALTLNFPISITTEPRIGLKLPRQIVVPIQQYLGLSPEPNGDLLVDCSERQNLPDIALDFAGHELLLGWEDYSAFYNDTYNPDPRPECAVNIAEVEDGQKSSIGMELLQKFDVVFDMDKSVVGLKAVRTKRVLGEV